MLETLNYSDSVTLHNMCEIIVEELKSFSANRQVVTPVTLYNSIVSRCDIPEFLGLTEKTKMLKHIYKSILKEVDLDLEGEYKNNILDLTTRMDNTIDLDGLFTLREFVLNFITLYKTATQEEKVLLVGLIDEIKSQLCEVESECLGLIENTARKEDASSAFESEVEFQMVDLAKSTESIHDISEIRNIVRVKLDAIKLALETKRTEDQLQQQSFACTLSGLQSNLKKMKERIDRNQKKRKSLEKEILIDPLTGIANRRALERQLRNELKKYRRHKHLFSVVFIDIDDFKKINDTFGHWVGDRCIKKIVRKIKTMIRETDFVARYGGDEFIILLTGTDSKGAQMVADKISNSISRTRFMYQSSEIRLSVSIGVAQVQETDELAEDMVARADSALYEIKKSRKGLALDCVNNCEKAG